MSHAEKTVTKLLMVGAIVVAGAAALYSAKTAGAMLMGYSATSGSSIVLMKASAVVSRVAAKFASYLHDVRNGENPEEAIKKYENIDAKSILPPLAALEANAAELQDEIGRLNARADELSQELSINVDGPETTVSRAAITLIEP
jgi:hypothetical protein